MSNLKQKEFDDKYVTGTEIAKSLGISRAAMCQAVSRGVLPNQILINNGQISLFDRTDVAPYIETWKAKRNLSNEK